MEYLLNRMKNSQPQIEDSNVTYSNVDGGWPGAGNIDTDPLFTHDYHLQPESPCIDTGDPCCIPTFAPATDIDGEPRVFSGCVDIGIDELARDDLVIPGGPGKYFLSYCHTHDFFNSVLELNLSF